MRSLRGAGGGVGSASEVMMRRVRVGVIGVGTMGANHVRVYSMLRGAELVGITDTDPGALRTAARRYDARAFADHHALLDHVEAVSLAVPTSSHYEIALECLRRGVHVLVEKPLAKNVWEGEALIAEADARGLVLQVGHIERFNPAVQELIGILRGERVLAVSARRLSPPTPRVRDVDVIFDLMIHDLDIACQIARSPVGTISSMGSVVKGDDLDLVMTHIEFANGVLADLIASKITQQRVRELEVTTENAYVTVNYRTRDISIYRHGTLVPEDVSSPAQYRQEAVIEKPLVRSSEPLYLELEHFIGCICHQRPLISARDALEALRLATQIRDQIAPRDHASVP